MSKKRLLAIIVWFAALATTSAIADVTHTPLDGANPGAATQGDAEEAVTRRLLRSISRHKNTTQSGGSDCRAYT